MFADYEILKDAIDLHVHVGPDYMPRYGDSIKLAQEAANVGMKALIIKNHLTSSVASAYLASKVVQSIHVFGGISLNEPCGGFNLRNVVAAIRSGAKMIWLPTVDAEYGLKKAREGHWIKHYVDSSAFGYPRKGLKIVDDNNKLLEEIHEVLRLSKENNVILGTGHISPEEALSLAKESKKIGYGFLEVTHPNAWLDDFNTAVLRELVSYGAMLTLSFGVCSPLNGRQDPAEIKMVIKEVGADYCCLITDYGQPVAPSPVEGYRCFCEILLKLGITKDELTKMTKTNPSRLLGI